MAVPNDPVGTRVSNVTHLKYDVNNYTFVVDIKCMTAKSQLAESFWEQLNTLSH